MYVDDFLFDADEIDDAISFAQELSDLLIAGGFLASQWRTLYHELISVNTLKIYRLGTLSTFRIEIRGVGNASKNTMCASVYFRVFIDNGSQGNLVVAKTIVFPLKTQSIPGVRLRNANIDYHTKHPVILIPDSVFATLMIRDKHENCLHDVVQLTLSLKR